jgi:hypothetical protein
MAQGGRRTREHPRDEGVVTGGRRSGGNASEHVTDEDLGEDGPDRWALSVSDGDVVTGWQAGSRMEIGRKCCRNRPAVHVSGGWVAWQRVRGENKGGASMGRGVVAGGPLWARPRAQCSFYLIQFFKQIRICNG